MSIEDIEAALRGPVGEPVKLTIARPPEFSLISTRIIREEIRLPSVTWYLYPEKHEIAVIKINIFASTTSSELVDVFKQSTDAGATDFIIDLRDNGGGLLTSGIDTAKLFLREGAIVQQQYRDRDIETHRIDHPGPLSEYPISILVNKGTASAAEIVAGALQAHGRAVIIGEPTFGKNSIQLVFNLADGSSLHVTAAEWWIPGKERDLVKRGIQPDIFSSQDDSIGEDMLTTAVEYLLTH
jgi:carboxyl-terminal processing protease